MAGKAKKKKKAVGAKKKSRAKTAAKKGKKSKSAASGSADAGESLRASAKSFAARLLR